MIRRSLLLTLIGLPFAPIVAFAQNDQERKATEAAQASSVAADKRVADRKQQIEERKRNMEERKNWGIE